MCCNIVYTKIGEERREPEIKKIQRAKEGSSKEPAGKKANWS